MVRELFYKFFKTLKRIKPELKFIMTGDFGQLLPVKDRVTNRRYEASRILHELCDGNKFVLKKCRRADDTLFKICERADSVSKKEFGNKKCRLAICFTNAKRREVNASAMKEYAGGKHTVEIEKLRYDAESQDMILFKGMPVIARLNYYKPCKQDLHLCNNDVFEIVKVGEDNIQIRNDDGVYDIATGRFSYFFYPAYCITTHKSQGETFLEPYSIYEWDKFDGRLKYVGLSRATCVNHINIM